MFLSAFLSVNTDYKPKGLVSRALKSKENMFRSGQVTEDLLAVGGVLTRVFLRVFPCLKLKNT